MPYRRKPRTLKGKNIKRKTGARAQSKQILSLSKAVTNLTKSNYETVQTLWYRNNLSVDSTGIGTIAYVCPVPKSMCNCFSQSTLDTAGNPDQRLKWSDNLAIASQQFYQKSPIFGSSEAARNSPESTHMGGVLKWRLQTNEPSFSTYSIFLISPKSRQADQLITDRGLKASTSSSFAGGGASLVQGVDYISHPNLFGTMINKKYYNVHYHREVNLCHPQSTALQTTAQANNTNPRNNALIAEGSIKLSGGSVLKCANQQSIAVSGSPDMGFQPVNASQLGYIDERNEKTQYLVVVNNGVSADAQTVNLSLLVKDVYKMVV
jgi:hypothetical protein